MEYELLHKMFNHNTPATIDLLPTATEEPLQKSYAGAFNALCDDLAVIRDQREQADRDHARRQMALAERQAAEAQRNRRQAAQRTTRLAKAAPPAPVAPPDFEGIAAQQEALAKSMERTAAQATENLVRARLQDLYHAARNGELAPMDVCRLDAIRCRAVEMGLRP